MEAWKDELYHHGIKGQVWGHRNGPPYPLGYSDHSAKQIRLAKKNKDRSMESFKKDSQTSQKKSLTDAQKRAIKIGAAAVGAALAVTGGVVLAKKLPHISAGKEIVDSFGSTPVKDLFSNPDAEFILNPGKEIPITEAYKGINPSYRSTDGFQLMTGGEKSVPLSHVNCQATVVAHEMKRRGIDCVAQLVDTTKYSSQYILEQVYKNPKIETSKCNSVSDLDKFLSRYSDGARGLLGIKIPDDDAVLGHAISWEKFKGKIIYFDDQAEAAFDSGMGVFEKVYKTDLSKGVTVCRTDNLELNDAENILKFVAKVT